MVLKVGKVGANSEPRFRYQHYGTSVGSSLARSILSHRVVWPWLGIESLDAGSVKEWMLTNLLRMHLFVPGALRLKS